MDAGEDSRRLSLYIPGLGLIAVEDKWEFEIKFEVLLRWDSVYFWQEKNWKSWEFDLRIAVLIYSSSRIYKSYLIEKTAICLYLRGEKLDLVGKWNLR